MADHQLSVAAEQPPPAPEPMKVGDTMEGVRNARYAARRPPAMRGGRRSRPMSAWKLESTRQTRWINDLNDVVI